MSASPERIDLGVRPTPVIDASSIMPGLWVKDDGRSAPGYGGNKPRKLEYLLHGAPGRVVTMGARGSHHALATAMHASRLGHDVHVVAFPRPFNAHVEIVFRATEADATMHTAADQADACLRLEQLSAGGLAIPAGGSSAVGAQGFIRAGRELVAQIESGLLPEPRRVYVAMGTAGTVVGLAIAMREAGLDTAIMAVRVVPEAWLSRRDVEQLSAQAAELAGLEPSMPVLVDEWLGAGYGSPTSEAEAAQLQSAHLLGLETTYTGKALAAALTDESGGPVLFWQTHNTHPLESNSD